jgi:hypothetical protein
LEAPIVTHKTHGNIFRRVDQFSEEANAQKCDVVKVLSMTLRTDARLFEAPIQ